MRSIKNALFLGIVCVAFNVRAQEVLTLEEAIQIALQKNFDVRLLQNTASTSLNDKRYSLGVFLPAINANGQITNPTQVASGVRFDGNPYEAPRSKNSNMNGAIQLNWTVFDGTKMFATRKRLDEIAEQGEINVKNQMMNSTASVVNNYFNIVRQKQQLVATAELTSFSEERLKLADLKLQVGTGAKPELLQAKLDLNQLRTANLSQETLLIQLKDQLRQLLGMELPENYEVADTIPINLTLSQDEILAAIENSNQTLLSIKKGISISDAALWEARAGRSPIINLTSSFNYQKTETGISATPSQDLSRLTKSYSYGISASLPILNGLNVQRNVSAARINIARQNLLYDQQKAVITTAVKNAYTSYDNAKKILLIEEENILLAKENANIALEGSKRGLYTFIEVRTAQQSLADGYNRLIAARYNAKLAETELLRLQGELVD